MAGFFRRSRGQDNVDVYTHTWAVFVFAFLALVFLLMPLGHSINGDSNTDVTDTDVTDNGAPPKVKVKAKVKCWCPAQFESSQVQYANRFCEADVNGILNGLHPKYSGLASRKPPSANLKGKPINVTAIQESQQPKMPRGRPDGALEKSRELIGFTTPLVLFLLALGLRIPHILWSVMTGAMSSCVNVDQVLESCLAVRPMDSSSQRQMYEENAMALVQAKRATSVTYLFMKVLTVLVVIVELFIVSQHVLPAIQAMRRDMAGHTTHGADSGGETGATTNSSLDGVFVYPNNIYHCFFQIEQMNVIHDHSVQCIVDRVDDSHRKPEGEASAGSPGSSQAQARAAVPVEDMLLVHEALFSIVLSVLAVLAVAAVINAVSWFTKLVVCSNTQSLGLPSNATMDKLLLIHMARINAGPRVAAGLANSWGSPSSCKSPDADNEPMVETKA